MDQQSFAKLIKELSTSIDKVVTDLHDKTPESKATPQGTPFVDIFESFFAQKNSEASSEQDTSVDEDSTMLFLVDHKGKRVGTVSKDFIVDHLMKKQD